MDEVGNNADPGCTGCGWRLFHNDEILEFGWRARLFRPERESRKRNRRFWDEVRDPRKAKTHQRSLRRRTRRAVELGEVSKYGACGPARDGELDPLMPDCG